MPKKQKRQTDEETTQSKKTAILVAAANVFFEKGYERATTLEIATTAKVSKRDIYEQFGSKQGLLESLIQLGAQRMQVPINLPVPENAKAFYAILNKFGQLYLENTFSPQNIAMYRLAIADSATSGAVASQLEISGHKPVISAVQKLFRESAEQGCIKFDLSPEDIVSLFFSTLIGDVRIKLLMGAPLKVDTKLIEGRVKLALRVVKQFEKAK
jgi:AcrR family transcriptional regulator